MVKGTRPGLTLPAPARAGDRCNKALELANPRGEGHVDRSIHVRIARVRRRIEAVPGQPAGIGTVRGRAMSLTRTRKADPPEAPASADPVLPFRDSEVLRSILDAAPMRVTYLDGRRDRKSVV